MKYLLACGGTAGHINPAIAIAALIKKEDSDAEIVFVGTKSGMENEFVSREGYPIYHINVRGLSRKLSLSSLHALALAAIAPHSARKIIKAVRPDIVIGTGGYVSWPLAVAAHKMKLPVLLHESNALPGLAVRMSEKYADRILLQFEAAKTHLKYKKKCAVVGSPLRQGFRIDKAEAKRRIGVPTDLPLVLSFGGSLGAMGLNREVMRYLAKHKNGTPKCYWIHGCGKSTYYDIKTEAEDLPSRFRILPYIENMPVVMAAADITVTRAGAITLSELAAAKAASILVPSPFVADNHQEKNAEALRNSGAAILILEKDISSKLAETVDTLLADREARRRLSDNISRFFMTDTDIKIAAEIKKALQKYSKKL